MPSAWIALVFEPVALALIVVGVVISLTMGSLPSMTATMTVAVLVSGTGIPVSVDSVGYIRVGLVLLLIQKGLRIGSVLPKRLETRLEDGHRVLVIIGNDGPAHSSWLASY